MQRKPRLPVALTRCSQYHSVDDLLPAVTDCLAAIGGMESYVSPGDTVLFKPNIGFEEPYTSGAVTNPFLTGALCILAKEAGAGKIIVGDGAIVGQGTQRTFQASGYSDLVRSLKEQYEVEVELIDLKSTDYSVWPVPGGRCFRRLHVPGIVMEADLIVTVPVMKTHDVDTATLGLKNMKGVIREQDKKKFHKLGLAEALVDLNRLVFPDLSIIDGTIAMEGLGPGDGDPVNLGLIIASENALAADVVAAHIMDIPIEDIAHLRLAVEARLGGYPVDWDTIEIRGLNLAEAVRPFKRHQLDFEQYGKEGIKVIEAGACSGCRHLVERFITNLETDGELDLLRGKQIVFGQSAEIPKTNEGQYETVLIGRCMDRHKNKYPYLPGCPPHPITLRAFLERLKSE